MLLKVQQWKIIEWNKSTNKKQWKEYDMKDITKEMKMTTAMH